MSRTPNKTRMLTSAVGVLAAAAVIALPAAAAERGAKPGPLAVELPGERVLERAERQAAQERRAARRKRRERREPSGPFVPVSGKADYGNGQNAFGAPRAGHMHAGHDMFAPPGTPLVAVADGVVIDAGADGGQGNYVHLFDPKHEQTYVYMHLVAPAKVGTGDEVKAGQHLGGVGCTGSCWGDHLHFEIRSGRGAGGEARDPLPDLKRWRSIDEPIGTAS